MYRLGKYYDQGLGGVEQNFGEAFRWYRNTAEAGNPNAMFHLGQELCLSQKIPRDPVEGVLWLRRAANFGHASAMFALG